jgi:membrane protein
MIHTIKQWLRCLVNAVTNTIHHDGIEHAGYLAFLGLLAFFPFLVFVVAIIGFLGQGEAGAGFITHLLQNLPLRVAEALKPRVDEIISGPPQGLLTVSILGAIWTASSAVEGLRTILNRAYHVRTPPAYWFRRSLSVIQLLVFTFILVVGMLLVIATPLLLHYVENWLGIEFVIANKEYWARTVVLSTIIALFVAVCYIYYAIPNIRQRFMSVAPGAALVVALWIGAARLFTLYLSKFQQVNLIYGSLGGIIAALIFFYICNIIFIFGAELNYQIVHLLGMRVEQREEVTTEEEQAAKK